MDNVIASLARRIVSVPSPEEGNTVFDVFCLSLYAWAYGASLGLW